MSNNILSWNCLTAIWCFAMLISFWPVAQAILAKVELNPGGSTFQDSQCFTDDEKTKLTQHYSRILGTLGFWKNKSEQYRRFHFYVILWTIPSSVIIPIVVQFGNNADAKLFLTIISTCTAILLALHRALKTEDNYKSFRHGESLFYDTFRRLLDRPESFGSTSTEQINQYFIEVEKIRTFVRNAETDNLAVNEQK